MRIRFRQIRLDVFQKPARRLESCSTLFTNILLSSSRFRGRSTGEDGFGRVKGSEFRGEVGGESGRSGRGRRGVGFDNAFMGILSL